MPANGEGTVGTTTAELVEVIPGRGAAIDFVTGAVAVGVVPLVGSLVVCVTCPVVMSNVIAALGAWDEVVGAVMRQWSDAWSIFDDVLMAWSVEKPNFWVVRSGP